MKKPTTMVTQVRAYLAHRRSLGFELESNGVVLLDFARFADRIRHRGPLTTAMMLRWATQSAQHSPRYRAQRLSIVRSFAQYIAARDGKSEVPDTRLLGSGYRRQQPHIYTDTQLRQLIDAAAKLPPLYPLRPQTYSTLFGMLASTGLRISEALGLQRADVDLEAGVLRIRQTKFHKSRLVPMHPTVTRVMRHYAACRDRGPANRSGLAFFVGWHGQPLPYSTVRQTFRRLCTKLRWHSNGVLPRPRIHDLRHNAGSRVMPSRMA